MAHGPKQPQTLRDCKIKPVYPAFRSVSTPRGTKDLRVVDPVNPKTTVGMPEGSERRAETLSERLRTELTPRVWSRLVRAAVGHGTSVEQLLRSTLSEVA